MNVDPEVPEEVLVQVLVGQLDHGVAGERGKSSHSEDDRSTVTLGGDGSVTRPLPVGPLPWFEP